MNTNEQKQEIMKNIISEKTLFCEKEVENKFLQIFFNYGTHAYVNLIHILILYILPFSVYSYIH